MNTELKHRQYGLKPLPKDGRDFSHHRVFGTPALPELPAEYFSAHPLEIKNQDINYNTDFCAAYGAAEVAEDQRGSVFVPEYTFSRALLILALAQNKPIEEVMQQFGLNLRDICEAAVRYGFLPREYDPYACNTVNRADRTTVVNPANWPKDLDMWAWENAENSYWLVDGPYDMFDNMRAVMWANRSEQRSILTGAGWRESWSSAPAGMIPETFDPNEPTSGHAFKIFGWMKCSDGSTRLVAQLSNGDKFGDNGLFYFPRSVINREMQYGSFTFKYLPKEKAQFHSDFNIPLDAGLWVKIFRIIQYAISRLFNRK